MVLFSPNSFDFLFIIIIIVIVFWICSALSCSSTVVVEIGELFSPG